MHSMSPEEVAQRGARLREREAQLAEREASLARRQTALGPVTPDDVRRAAAEVASLVAAQADLVARRETAVGRWSAAIAAAEARPPPESHRLRDALHAALGAELGGLGHGELAAAVTRALATVGLADAAASSPVGERPPAAQTSGVAARDDDDARAASPAEPTEASTPAAVRQEAELFAEWPDETVPPTDRALASGLTEQVALVPAGVAPPEASFDPFASAETAEAFDADSPAEASGVGEVASPVDALGFDDVDLLAPGAAVPLPVGIRAVHAPSTAADAPRGAEESGDGPEPASFDDLDFAPVEGLDDDEADSPFRWSDDEIPMQGPEPASSNGDADDEDERAALGSISESLFEAVRREGDGAFPDDALRGDPFADLAAELAGMEPEVLEALRPIPGYDVDPAERPATPAPEVPSFGRPRGRVQIGAPQDARGPNRATPGSGAAARFAALAAGADEGDPWSQLEIGDLRAAGHPGPLPLVQTTPPPELAAPRGDARRAPRAHLAVKVGLEHGNLFFTGFSGNVGGGGLFVSTHQMLPVGTELDLFFEMPDGHPVATRARVRWVREPDPSRPHGAAGMGVSFLSLQHDDEIRIERWVAAHDHLLYDPA